MNLYISENIKRLRRQKDITQETLAERMHVSAAAVSKWKRGEALPDISMVIPLASYFGVSTDEILGLQTAKNEERIRSYLNEYHRLGAIGKVYERFNLMVNAYHEYPNDWRIVEEYMWQLNYDPNCTGPYGNEVHKKDARLSVNCSALVTATDFALCCLSSSDSFSSFASCSFS